MRSKEGELLHMGSSGEPVLHYTVFGTLWDHVAVLFCAFAEVVPKGLRLRCREYWARVEFPMLLRVPDVAGQCQEE